MTQGQNKPVRSREEQVANLTASIRVWGRSSLEAIRPMAERYIREAEARGAEEQRRKDAEGQEPAAWVRRSEFNDNWPMRAGVWRSCRLREFTIPLYTHPANVAALEARIAELEAEVTALKKPAYYAVEGDDFCQNSVADIFDSCDAEHNTIIQVNGFRQVSSQWAFFDGENLNTFPTEAEAEAALTREGGE